MRRIDISIGQRLRLIREQLGLSQAQLAKKIGFSQNAISHWERGERDIPTQALIALKRLGINIDWLLTGEGTPLTVDPKKEEIYQFLKEIESKDPATFEEIYKIFKSIASLILSKPKKSSMNSNLNTLTNSGKAPKNFLQDEKAPLETNKTF